MTKDIEVATRHGPITITATATIVPQLWVHPGIAEDGWTVSHLPSGKRVAWGIETRARGLRFVAEVAPLQIDWARVHEPTDIPTEQRRAFKCLRKKYQETARLRQDSEGK